MPTTKIKKSRKSAAGNPRALPGPPKPFFCSEMVLNMLDRKIRELDSKGSTRGRSNTIACRGARKRQCSVPNRRPASPQEKQPGKSILRKSSAPSMDKFYPEVNNEAGPIINKPRGPFVVKRSPTHARREVSSACASTTDLAPQQRWEEEPFHSVPNVLPHSLNAKRKECRVRFKSSFSGTHQEENNSSARGDPNKDINLLMKKYSTGTAKLFPPNPSSCKPDRKCAPNTGHNSSMMLNGSRNKAANNGNDWNCVQEIGAEILAKYNTIFSDGDSQDKETGQECRKDARSVNGSNMNAQRSSSGINKWKSGTNFEASNIGTNFDTRPSNDGMTDGDHSNGFNESSFSKYNSSKYSDITKSFRSGSFRTALDACLPGSSKMFQSKALLWDNIGTGVGSLGSVSNVASKSSSFSSYKKPSLNFNYLTKGGSVCRDYLSKTVGFESGSPFTLPRTMGVNNSNITNSKSETNTVSLLGSTKPKSNMTSVDQFLGSVISERHGLDPREVKRSYSTHNSGTTNADSPTAYESKGSKTYHQIFDSLVKSGQNVRSKEDIGQFLKDLRNNTSGGGRAYDPSSSQMSCKSSAQTKAEEMSKPLETAWAKGGGESREGREGEPTAKRYVGRMVNIMAEEKDRLSNIDSIIGRVSRSFPLHEGSEKK